MRNQANSKWCRAGANSVGTPIQRRRYRWIIRWIRRNCTHPVIDRGHCPYCMRYGLPFSDRNED